MGVISQMIRVNKSKLIADSILLFIGSVLLLLGIYFERDITAPLVVGYVVCFILLSVNIIKTLEELKQLREALKNK